MKFLAPKIAIVGIVLVVLAMLFVPKLLAASSNTPQVSITTNNSQESISVVFPQAVSSGNIVDIELYNSSNAKIWQYSTTNGGTNFSATPPLLSSGTYWISVGLFTPNWASNYAWFDKIATLTMSTQISSSATVSQTPSPSPTPTPTASVSQPTPTPTVSSSTPTPTLTTAVQNNSALSSAQNAYSDWKAKYVTGAGGNMLRVVRPENNNDTVSEGIGYGMLLSTMANDQTTFAGLWNYGKKYLDSKGLMNWQIDSGGNVIGQGSATDADEDMAYALTKANALWPGQGYDSSAKSLISAIKSYDTVNNFMNPGDNWGNTPIMNPSYLALSYYKAFASFTGDNSWNDIATKNSNWLTQVSNISTGLVPDWKNVDLSDANVSWDTHKNDFYYDALRNPIRLLMDYKATGDQNAVSILQKQNWFFSSIGPDKLEAGYTLSGQPIGNYMDSAFLSSYTAASQIDPNSSFAQAMVQKLINTSPSGYFGTSLRSITLFVIAGQY